MFLNIQHRRIQQDCITDLHILNVGESDVKKYICEVIVNGQILSFYLQLILSGRCKYTSVVSKVWTIKGFIVVGESRILFEARPL
jgi:hypothetical protein